MVQHDVISAAGRHQALGKLVEMKSECALNFRGDGYFHNKRDEKKAKEIQMHMLTFYENLLDRPELVKEGQSMEENLSQEVAKQPKLTFQDEENYAATKGGLDIDTQFLNTSSDAFLGSEVSQKKANSNGEDTSGSLGIPSITNKAGRVSSKKSANRNTARRRSQVGHSRTSRTVALAKDHLIHKLLTAHNNDSSSKELSREIKKLKLNPTKAGKYIACWKSVNMLFELFKDSWLRCRHLALIISHFFQGHMKRSKYFGSYRVELVVLLFHRLTDVQNFDLITKRLMPYEIACLYCRIGYLKLFNPMKPEGSHFLNISNREERILTKMMGALSTLEPGENWIDETFQWELEMDPIPGW